MVVSDRAETILMNILFGLQILTSYDILKALSSSYQRLTIGGREEEKIKCLDPKLFFVSQPEHRCPANNLKLLN